MRPTFFLGAGARAVAGRITWYDAVGTVGFLLSPVAGALTTQRAAAAGAPHWCTEEKHTVLITRVVAVTVFGLALATGALAQTTPATPTAPTAPAAPSSSLEGLKQEHPDWFTSRRPYMPCPSSVAFNGRGACLGCPVRCPGHF
jgi:hypothetical protein